MKNKKILGFVIISRVKNILTKMGWDREYKRQRQGGRQKEREEELHPST